MKFVPTLALLASIASAQDLATALGGYKQASKFTSLVSQNSGIASQLLAPRTRGYTVLVPSDAAFDKYTAKYGIAVTSLTLPDLTAILQYHVLVARLTKANFTQPHGITVPTLLKGEANNNRTAGAALTSAFGEGANGQVLFISKDPIDPAKFRVRQTTTSAGGDATLRAGLGQTAGLEAVDGTFDGGRFQIVDSFLEPPGSCSKTIRGIDQLAALDNALNRSGIWPVLNNAPNVTCLAPNSPAFKAAGDADQKLTQQQLASALEFHTLQQPLYTNFLTDGMVVSSFANATVTVYIRGEDIFFNDAKVVSPNVLTNNGLIHILDKVMSEGGKPSGTATTGGNNATSTSAGSSATSSSAAASGADMNGGAYFGGLLSILFAALLI